MSNYCELENDVAFTMGYFLKELLSSYKCPLDDIIKSLEKGMVSKDRINTILNGHGVLTFNELYIISKLTEVSVPCLFNLQAECAEKEINILRKALINNKLVIEGKEWQRKKDW